MTTLPASLMASLKNIKGFDKEAFEAVHASGAQVVSIRLNPLKWPIVRREAAGVRDEAEPNENDSQSAIANLQSAIEWCPNGYYLSHRPSFTFDPLFHAGVYYVQEASSMFLWEALKQTIGDNTTGMRVLDLCAAPGGKSTLLASYFADGLVVANEVIRQRAAILVENITKWGSANSIVTNNDPKDFAGLEGYFDVMAVDAPCSGSGLFRRDADAIEEWSEENVLLCSQRQQRVLADAYATLKKGGLLIYSTCSYSKEEGEDILDWLCRTFNVESIPLRIEDSWGIVETQSSGAKAYGYRFYPYKVKGEGFFIAVFRKLDGEINEARAQALPKASKEEEAAAAQLAVLQNTALFKQAENIVAIPADYKTDVAYLQKHLYLRKAGITIGSLKGKDIVPAHELAMSTLTHDNVQRFELNRQQAIQYLQKKELRPNGGKGWALAVYENIPLGWMKVLPNRINNYYPVEWRILKEHSAGK